MIRYLIGILVFASIEHAVAAPPETPNKGGPLFRCKIGLYVGDNRPSILMDFWKSCRDRCGQTVFYDYEGHISEQEKVCVTCEPFPGDFGKRRCGGTPEPPDDQTIGPGGPIPTDDHAGGLRETD